MRAFSRVTDFASGKVKWVNFHGQGLRTSENIRSKILCRLTVAQFPQVNPPMKSPVLDTALAVRDS